MPDWMVLAFWAVVGVTSYVLTTRRRQRMNPQERRASVRRGHGVASMVFLLLGLMLLVATATAIVKGAGWVTGLVVLDVLAALAAGAYFYKRSRAD